MPYLVFVTCPEPSVAESIITTLVNERLVACGSILPGLTSIYRWKGVVETASECLVVLKTNTHLLSELESRISELHPYEVPEILSVEADRANATYARWVDENVRGR